ncbi:hypothetical protein DESC_140048 [Desulfosarcina cetonica]|nr:hypothetical protein DESC_140048 [Desulfosarcina cetonica]
MCKKKNENCFPSPKEAPSCAWRTSDAAHLLDMGVTKVCAFDRYGHSRYHWGFIENRGINLMSP